MSEILRPPRGDSKSSTSKVQGRLQLPSCPTPTTDVVPGLLRISRLESAATPAQASIAVTATRVTLPAPSFPPHRSTHVALQHSRTPRSARRRSGGDAHPTEGAPGTGSAAAAGEPGGADRRADRGAVGRGAPAERGDHHPDLHLPTAQGVARPARHRVR